MEDFESEQCTPFESLGIDTTREYKRRGGPQAFDADDEEESEQPPEEADRKVQDRARKKAEVRARLQEAGKAKKAKAKKGFLTPERKKKLRKLLMQKAAEDLKREQLKKEQERQKALQERIVKLPELSTITSEGELEKLAKELHQRLISVYSDKYDLDYEVRQKDFEINELTIAVNDLRGKFVKPALKKVSKYPIRMKKLHEGKEEKLDYRSGLKSVKKKAYEIGSIAENAEEAKEPEKEEPPKEETGKKEVAKKKPIKK